MAGGKNLTRTPRERAEALIRLRPSTSALKAGVEIGGQWVPFGRDEDAAHWRRVWVGAAEEAIREAEADLLRLGAGEMPYDAVHVHDMLQGAFPRAEAEMIGQCFDHLRAQVAFMARDNGYEEGYALGYAAGYEAGAAAAGIERNPNPLLADFSLWGEEMPPGARERDLCRRLRDAMALLGIATRRELSGFPVSRFGRTYGVGPKTVGYAREWLAEAGLTFEGEQVQG
jgi:hypothetical protein